MRRLLATLLLTLAAPCAALAEGNVYQFPEDEAEAQFIADEVMATFYHELGHGLISVLGLPVLGKEEDAADSLSVVLMNDFWSEDDAQGILTSDATAYALLAKESSGDMTPERFADEHSLDLQRYFSVVCMFYGADPEGRKGLADTLKLPEDTRDRCPRDWEQAAGSWDALLQDAVPGEGTFGLVMAEGQEGVPLADLLAGEVEVVNERFGLPVEITVKVQDCGEANAFFNREDNSITMCNEYAQNLQRMWESQ